MLSKIASRAWMSALLLGASIAYGASPTPQIDQQSDLILKSATDYLTSLQSFSYTAQTFLESVSNDNEKLLFDSKVDISVKRPNKIFAQKTGYEALDFYFNGNKIVGYNATKQKYATADEPGDLDKLVKALSTYQIEAPMSDFITSDPYAILTADIESSRFLGVAMVAGVKCHHLAFRQNNIDWQLWIEASAKPLIKRFMVTSKGLTGSPSYTVTINQWKSNPVLDDAMFEFKAPAASQLVEFADLNKE
jgi:hypothetical protein